MTWAVVKSTWQKHPRYEFTTHVEHRSAINTSLKQGGRSESVDVLSGVVEARNVRGSSPIIDKVRPMRYPRVC